MMDMRNKNTNLPVHCLIQLLKGLKTIMIRPTKYMVSPIKYPQLQKKYEEKTQLLHVEALVMH